MVSLKVNSRILLHCLHVIYFTIVNSKITIVNSNITIVNSNFTIVIIYHLCLLLVLIDNKIKQEFSAPDSQFQNGTAERNWRTLFEMAKCLLIEANLPKYLWNYAVRAAMNIRNRCYNPRLNVTPYEAFTNKVPNVSKMYVFGSKCHALLQNTKKLESKSEEGIFVGNDPTSPAFLVFNPTKGVVRKVRCVNFSNECRLQREECHGSNENIIDISYDFFPVTINNSDNTDHTDESDTVNEDNENVSNASDGETAERDVVDASDEHDSTTQVDEVQSPIAADDQEPAATNGRYPKRNRKQPSYLGDYNLSDSNIDVDSIDCVLDYVYNVRSVPKNYSEAISCNDSPKWQKAMQEELAALKNNNTFTLSELPSNRKAIGGRWVYALKESPDQPDRYKARYVAKGYHG